MFLYAKVSRSLSIGQQGICEAHSHILKKGIFVSKAVVSIPTDKIIPIKVLNPGDESVVLYKNSIIANLTPFDNTYSITPVDFEGSQVQTNVNNINTESKNFEEYFELDDNLTTAQKAELFQCLKENKSIFVTEDNPGLGFTKVVEHQIHLKPDAKSKHQRPYKLSPEKREVLRHQLDNLLKQGIIAPVHESENVPITSPIVLVSKRNKPKNTPDAITPEYSMSSYRFCCDFRFLDSQTQDFTYNITDLQELTESFSHKQDTKVSVTNRSLLWIFPNGNF